MKKCSLIAIVLFAVILVVHVPNAEAQCSLTYYTDTHSDLGITATAGIGQSFVACQTGFVSAVTLFSGSFTDTPGTLNLEPQTYIAGVYFYRIEAGDYYETKRMLLLK